MQSLYLKMSILEVKYTKITGFMNFQDKIFNNKYFEEEKKNCLQSLDIFTRIIISFKDSIKTIELNF